MFPVKLIEYMNEFKINTICWVSSALAFVSGLGIFDAVKPKYLHTISFGSEIFPIKQFKSWLTALPSAKFFNLYGPTEATGMSTFYEIDNDSPPDDIIPIGRAFPNVSVFLADNGIEITEPSVRGIIYIRGAGITNGYYNDEEKTKESFIQNPLHNHYNEIVYNTGDIGEYNAQGDLVYISRSDSQIKRHGYRIEIIEIESVANELEEVAVACCVYSRNFDKIALYYCSSVDDGFDEKKMIKSLRRILPAHMMPDLVIKLANMPTQGGHKIDRATLTKQTEDRLNG
jgi:non-ribosomal peptide synthetase component F